LFWNVFLQPCTAGFILITQEIFSIQVVAQLPIGAHFIYCIRAGRDKGPESVLTFICPMLQFIFQFNQFLFCFFLFSNIKIGQNDPIPILNYRNIKPVVKMFIVIKTLSAPWLTFFYYIYIFFEKILFNPREEFKKAFAP